MTLTSEKFIQIIEAARKKKELAALETAKNTVSAISTISSKQAISPALQALRNKIAKAGLDSSKIGVGATPKVSESITQSGRVIEYNEKQREFINLATSGVSCILIGAAGTGKTTCMRGTIEELIRSGYAGLLSSDGHKYLPVTEVPGIVAISYTRRAVNNLRKSMPTDMVGNCITIHKLLEYEPVYYTVLNETTGEEKNTMMFEPTRNNIKPLPHTIKTIIIDESSMVSTELFSQLIAACPHKPQFIFLGDIQQLPPVFGAAILGYKMLELPTVELTEVYRQAMNSPIIKLAHRVLSGKPILLEEYSDWKLDTEQGKLTIHPWKKKLHSAIALETVALFFCGNSHIKDTPKDKIRKGAIEVGEYNVEEDIILVPFNKSLGTDELNKHIAGYLAHRDKRVVYEIVAGFTKHYYSVGEKVLYDKEDAIIENIYINPTYAGTKPVKESVTLNYWGVETSSARSLANSVHKEMSEDDMDFILNQVTTSNSSEERIRQASHKIVLRLLDSDKEVTIETAAAVNTMILSYALTVHKAQGSEWRKVFLIFHQSHNTMIQRELLYTAITRAKEELYIICEPETFTKGIIGQRIKGNTLAEKAEYFKGKIDTLTEKEKKL